MRVERLDAQLLRFPMLASHRDQPDAQMEVLLVTAHAGEHWGLGLTFTVQPGGGLAVRALVDHVLRPLVVGQHAYHTERLWAAMYQATHRLGRGIAALAIAAIDMALWDLKARAAGVPLADYLGGYRDRVPAYGSGRSSHQFAVDELVAQARAQCAEGLAGVKIRIGARPLAEDLARVRAVREALGPAARLMVDANERYTLSDALWLAPRLAELGVYWFEEPLDAEHVDAYAVLARQSPVPIAVGEHLQSRHAFAAYARQGAAHILQPDVAMLGGVTEFLKIAAVADAAGLPIAPHFLHQFHIHLAAAIPNSLVVEHFPALDFLFLPEERCEVRAGDMLVPRRPGFGLTPRPEVVAEYRVP
ncbi:MAG TPA: mandelate racemase/muconate lactonizing enzyme family protein [Chloroflexota bacterium]|jgi:L-alanine-DL-glutamate epimerase-like enolase superfamily enzyme|nr:mandelate racemase/muconate lactonizing enzyme family protein [Chloroflexota bacterium]